MGGAAACLGALASEVVVCAVQPKVAESMLGARRNETIPMARYGLAASLHKTLSDLAAGVSSPTVSRRRERPSR